MADLWRYTLVFGTGQIFRVRIGQRVFSFLSRCYRNVLNKKFSLLGFAIFHPQTFISRKWWSSTRLHPYFFVRDHLRVSVLQQTVLRLCSPCKALVLRVLLTVMVTVIKLTGSKFSSMPKNGKIWGNIPSCNCQNCVKVSKNCHWEPTHMSFEMHQHRYLSKIPSL